MSDSELVLAHIIITRYFSILEEDGFEKTISDKKVVDILCYIHNNCCPLDLETFSVAKEYLFMRCMIGILSNYDADKNEFAHGFWPRYAIEHHHDPGCEH